ncbi:DUF4437 domain-containing protein [Leptolyngbya sp. NIES-2104]|uniref:DUF4437 domain-containing protein n=1 Tax=Leptolyngbya sp. NIES-2104 TaxID=1552121 RepID=UPI0006EC4F03|nr:DUF4437 domain-containing protein [Leptolyngbya sp. NIES-2104]GAP96269.1 hypothetical protein NIES2104_28040 [Leptolyngbya sp. NIES-2104]
MNQNVLGAEDWGGTGQSRMNLSGRTVALAELPQQYQFFDTQRIPQQPWQIDGLSKSSIAATHQLLSWHEHGASTTKVLLADRFELPAGRFTADLEIFVLSGTVQVGAWKLSKHGYSFIPAGVRVGPWKALNGEAVELLWMENDRLQYQDLPHDSAASLDQFIPVLDSTLLPWSRTDTMQFAAASKKWLRKAANGGGVWLLALLPHYDSQQAMIQLYNEEVYGLGGHCDMGKYRFAKHHFGYCPSFSTVPRHISAEGSLFFIRVDRDLSRSGAVLPYTD